MNKTINKNNILEFFCGIGDWEIADGQTLTAELHEVYCAECESVESLSDFSDFGKIVLADFNEIDENLVSAQDIFRVVAELKNQNDLSFLSENQIAVIKRFFDFSGVSKAKNFWAKIDVIYEKFKTKLAEKKIAYSGMLMREIAENIENYTQKFTAEKYVFEGFYEFSEAEKKIVNFLNDCKKADFIWDFAVADGYIEHFGGELLKNETENKKITFYKCVNSFSQIEIVSKIEQNQPQAVILFDEKMLPFAKNILGEKASVFLFDEAQRCGSADCKFKNLIFLSADSTNLPKIDTASLIPQEVRKAFAMTTIQKQEVLQKFQFDRLVFNAENISFCFCEPSAYLLQLEYESGFEIEKKTQKIEISPSVLSEPISVEKTPEMLLKLREKYAEKPLSPSAFNIYIDCPLQFFFKYIAEIKTPEEKELNHAALGKIFHKTMELIHKEKDEISDYEKITEAAFSAENFAEKYKTGEGLIISKVVLRMLKNMLEYDKNREEKFEITGLEEEHFFETDGIKIGGIIDRIDRVGDKIRIVDYKTGGRAKIASYEFQTYLYSRALSAKFDEAAISSELIFVLESRINGEKIEYLSEKKEEFDEKFNEKLNELFNIETAFFQCDNENICKYCDYGQICARK